MLVVNESVPYLSPFVTVSEKDSKGRYVVKNSRKRTYHHIGEEESFLLHLFDGKTTYSAVAASFEQHFGDPITGAEVRDFAVTARKQGLATRQPERRSQPRKRKSFLARCRKQAAKQSAVYFRVSVFDPNASLSWLEPRTRWLFSLELAMFAALFGCVAIFIAWSHWQVLLGQTASMLNWRCLTVAWFTLVAVTIAHEYGHGLACKRYGGEVRELGVLWIFFTPCFYCNVSDAWLLPSRARRLLVSMAGTYVDFLIWIFAVLLWRFAAPGTWLSVATWVIVTTCGIRVAFNANPFMRLDGYYALSDLLDVPNLRRRGRARIMEYARWILWGAERPQPIPQGKTLLAYGVVNWTFVMAVMALVSFNLSSFLQEYMGVGGLIAAATFFALIMKRYFKGSLGEDFRTMFQSRKLRVLVWVLIIVGIGLIPITDRAGGEFFVRARIHAEVRAPIDGFIREIAAQQGDSVEAGEILVRMEVPELQSQLRRKKLEIAESEANLRLLESGTRPEEIQQQTAKIERATTWRDLAKRDLARAQDSFQSELDAFRFRVEKANNDLRYRKTIVLQAKQLHAKGGIAGQQLLSLERQVSESQSELNQIESEKQARTANGVITFEAELARREKELADVIGAKTLMEAGSRPEQIEAEQARLRRLKEELRHFEYQEGQQVVHVPVNGTVTTPRLNEKIGQFIQRGQIVCSIEDLSELEAEIAVSEHDAYILKPGQPVSLRPRSLPFQSIVGKVERIAPATQATAGLGASDSANAATAGAAAPGNNAKKAQLAVYCHVDNADGMLVTGMTGFGRVHAEKKCLAWYMMNKALRLMRTEFWW